MAKEFNPELQAAFDYESKLVGDNLEDLMAEMLDNADRSGEKAFDDLRARKMIFAIRHLERERDELKRYKKAVAAEWDTRIKGKEENIERIKDYLFHSIQENNEGKTLHLDVATLSCKKVPASFSVDKTKIGKMREYLQEAGILEQFLKPAEINETLAKNQIASMISSGIVQPEAFDEIGTYNPEGQTLSIRMK